MEVREHGPAQQGLRHLFVAMLASPKVVREHGPAQQGLRQPADIPILAPLFRQRAWSSTTRIKTERFRNGFFAGTPVREHGPAQQGLRQQRGR